MKILTAISVQMMTSYQGSQDTLIRNNLKLTTDSHDSKRFKQEVHKELNTLQNTCISNMFYFYSFSY
jgi:hypothetical protein